MSVSDAIASLGAQTYTITRPTPGTITGGVYQAGPPASFTIMAQVHPLGPRELMRLPELERARARVRIYTTTRLQVLTGPGGSLSDQIAFDGDAYEIEGVEDFAIEGGYYKAIARKMGQ